MLTGPAWSNLLVLAGLGWAAFAVAGLLTQPVSPVSTASRPGRWDRVVGGSAASLGGPGHRRVGWRYLGPQLLVAAGFWLSGSVDTVWFIAVVAAIAGLCVAALRMLGTENPPGGASAALGPARASVLATTVLLQVGALLTVRLAVVPDPTDPFGAGLSGAAWEVGHGALGMPLLGIAVVLAVFALPSTRRCVAGWSWGEWFGIGRSLPGRSRGERPAAGRPTGRPFGRSGRLRPALLGAAAAVLVIVPFGLPLLDDTGSGAALTFQGVATPEFGKLFFVLVIAMLAARHSHRFGGVVGPGRATLGRYAGLNQRALPVLRAWWRARRFVIYPLGLFTLVAAVSGALRQDFGTVVSVLCATVGITWAATRHAVQQAPDLRSGSWYHRIGRRLRRTVAAYRPFLLPGGGLLLVTGLIAWFATDYVSERGRVWADPWLFRWAAGCLPPDSDTTPPGIPAGFVACQRSLLADAESERSQMAQALATVADGGLWGRGLADTASGALPAGSTDFILVVMWNKLGGLVVVAAVILVILLGAALRQAAGRASTPTAGGPGLAGLVAAGFTAMLVGQCLFVFAATLNLLPHSGVPAPFLSRGGQSNLALLWGVLLVLGLSLAGSGGVPGASRAATSVRPPGYASAPAPHGHIHGYGPSSSPNHGYGPSHGHTGSRTGRSLVGGWAGRLLLRGVDGRAAIIGPIAFCLAVATAVTVVPYPAPNLINGRLPTAYGEHRPPCPPHPATRDGLTSAPPDPAVCSTDQFARGRTRIEVRLASGPALVLDQPEGTWRLPARGRPDGLVLADLAGLLRTGEQIGVLEQSYPEVVGGTAGTDLRRRLAPWPRVPEIDGGLDLTIRPDLQHLAAETMRSTTPAGDGPLSGGLVVLDARSGALLAAVSVPADGYPATAAPASADRTADRSANMGDANTGDANTGDGGDEASRFLTEHGNWARLGPDGALDGSVPDDTCAPQNDDPTRQAGCWRWSLSVAPPDGTTAARERELRRYVAGDTKAQLPSPGVNRAFGQWYGLGSTFKVVIAAAYLETPGASATDLIAAPAQIDLWPREPIRNAGGGRCPGTTDDGRISLTRALAVSCNTAFVALAQDLGWDRVAEMAGRFGFHVGPCQGTEPVTSHRLVGGVGSCVPAHSDPVSIGNNALGGQDVVGTPLALAGVMATVANGGQAVTPTLVRAARPPGTERPVSTPIGPAGRVIAPAVAEQLRAALGRTADDGTAAGLRTAVGADLWVKTGTHEVVPQGQESARADFVRQNCWLVGFMQTPAGPVAFAAVVESRDERAGGRRVRNLVETVGAALRRQR